jgi:hypothetical protein
MPRLFNRFPLKQFVYRILSQSSLLSQDPNPRFTFFKTNKVLGRYSACPRSHPTLSGHRATIV